MKKAIVGKKLGMTQLFDKAGKVILGLISMDSTSNLLLLMLLKSTIGIFGSTN